MSDSIGSLRRRALAATCFTLSVAAPAFAQRPLAEPPTRAEFFSRFDLALSAAALSHEDDRFSWDTHWMGDFDLVDYKYGRATFLADYQALLGSEFRPFDPYQSNYTLEASGSYRAGRTEIAGVLNHISRHLGDRSKRDAVAENSLGARVMRQFRYDRGTVDTRVDVRKVIARSYMDYTWMGEIDVTVRRAVSPRSTVYGRVYGQAYAVDPTLAGRDHQYGGRIEVGVRVAGARGALELFAGAERVIDADPLDRLPRRWPFAGFRLLGR